MVVLLLQVVSLDADSAQVVHGVFVVANHILIGVDIAFLVVHERRWLVIVIHQICLGVDVRYIILVRVYCQVIQVCVVQA